MPDVPGTTPVRRGKQSGKTRLLELLHFLCRRSRHAASISAASLFRLIELERTTLLIDEADTIWKSCSRCVGEGANQQPKEFSVFSPVAVAGIGQLPTPSTTGPWSSGCGADVTARASNHSGFASHAGEALELQRHLAAWVSRRHDDLAADIPVMPPGLVDRAADVGGSRA